MRLPARLYKRKADSHKGNYGHILIIAGSRRYSGAGVLCADAAMRSGAGLVTLGIPEGINNAMSRVKPREVMTLPLPETKDGNLSLAGYKEIKDFLKKIDLIVIGPGLGGERSTQILARKVVCSIDKPKVIDADALNAFIAHLHLLLTLNSQLSTILTPHPGEMARLLGISISKVQKNRTAIAKKFAKDHKITVALKGHNTVVADDQGNFYINKTGNAGMATAGSGDVLSGIIAAFLGQGLSAFNAAKYGVYLHGLAGDLAAKEKTQICMVASDIIAKIPEAIKRCS